MRFANGLSNDAVTVFSFQWPTVSYPAVSSFFTPEKKDLWKTLHKSGDAKGNLYTWQFLLKIINSDSFTINLQKFDSLRKKPNHINGSKD